MTLFSSQKLTLAWIIMDQFDYAVVALVFILSLIYLYYKPSTSTSAKAKAASSLKNKSVSATPVSSGFLGRMKQKNAKVIIFYGSQTGTAEDYARRLMKEGIPSKMTCL